MAKKKPQKYYVVWRGRTPGVFDTWSECSQQIAGYSGAQYKSFATRQEAVDAFKNDYESYKETAPKRAPALKRGTSDYEALGVILDSVCVDAACSGNPGQLEYQGIETDTGAQIFHKGPFAEGTVNIGEFLAIVHALAQLQQEGRDCPVYSDSTTAMAWVRKRHANTKLARTSNNARLFRLLRRAEAWLENNTYPNEVLKWRTEAWGEIPADFGRK